MPDYRNCLYNFKITLLPLSMLLENPMSLWIASAGHQEAMGFRKMRKKILIVAMLVNKT